MRNQPSLVYAWVTGGVAAALCAVSLFAAREIMDGDRPELSLTEVLQESIGFVVFSIPMFIILLIPAVMTILSFRHATTQSSGILCLMISFVTTVGAVFLLSRIGDKVFPSDFTTAVSYYVFAGAGAMILWIRTRATNRVETPTDGNHH